MIEKIKKTGKYWEYIIPLVCIAFIAAMTYTFLYDKNKEVFVMVQAHSLFNDTWEFFCNCMKTPGGALQWIGLWFTQLFYNPGTGISILAAMWMVALLLLQKAFRIPAMAAALTLIPVTALLISQIDLGYWIYIMKIPGYHFRESLGVICLALLVWLARADRWSAAATVVAALSYPLIGFYAPLSLACIFIANIIRRRWIGTVTAGIAGVLSPLVWHNIYNTMRSDQWYTIGFPVFESENFTDTAAQMPFIVITASLLFMAVLSALPWDKLKGKARVATASVLTILAMAGCGYAIDTYQYDDDNYRAECKAYIAAQEMRWEDVLATIENSRCDITRELVILKNIALFETGDIGNRLYQYDDYGVKPNAPDSLNLPMSYICSPLVLLYHGKTNFATRWAIENSVEFGFNVTELKIMVLAALVNEEPLLAEKYLNILSHTMYYKEWAEKYRKLAQNIKSIGKYPELKHIIDMRNFMNNKLDSDVGMTEKYLMSYYANSQCINNKHTQEVCLVYALMTRDIVTFWNQFMLYAQLHKGEEMPIHYQEAAYMYGKLEPQTMDISRMPFDKERIVERYEKFNATAQNMAQMGMSEKSIGQNMRSEFGNTFWWVYYFNRGSVFY